MIVAHEPLGRRGVSTAGVLAVLALLLAVAALVLSIFRDPTGPIYRMRRNALGSPLRGYDFSTPSDALRSNLKMEHNRDLPAVLEYSRLVELKELQEKIDTLEIRKEVELKLPKKTRPSPRAADRPAEKGGDKKPADKKPEKTREIKLLFITYKEDGEMQYKVEAYERHQESGLWKRTYVSEYEVRDVNADLAKEMQEWEAKTDGKDKP